MHLWAMRDGLGLTGSKQTSGPTETVKWSTFPSAKSRQAQAQWLSYGSTQG